jgi:hypothetical protein
VTKPHSCPHLVYYYCTSICNNNVIEFRFRTVIRTLRICPEFGNNERTQITETTVTILSIWNPATPPRHALDGDFGARWFFFYKDSFGVLPPEEVISFCKKIPKSHLAYNDFAFQDIKAETCGWFVCGLLIHIQNHPNMDLYDACSDYIHMYSYDTKKTTPY